MPDKRFIVISYDDDQQQAFYDGVEAESNAEALLLIAEARPYAIPVDCCDLDTFASIATACFVDRRDILTRDYNPLEVKE
jgi:hypothetical protein